LLAAQRHQRAFEALYHRYKDTVWSYCYVHCSDPQAAEEAVQETFLKAWRAQERYEQTGTPKAWLLTICRNTCIDRQRSASRSITTVEWPSDLDIADPSWETEPVERIAVREAVAAFGDMVAEIPHEELEAWFLRDVMDCSSSETALIVGAAAASTIRSRVMRAREKIAANVLERQCGSRARCRAQSDA